MNEEEMRSFYISYKDGYFKAYAYSESRDAYTLRDLDRGLEELFQRCRDAGFNHLEGLSEEAIEAIYGWLIKASPVFDYVEALWDGESSARRGMGFKPRKPLQGVDLECYGIKPTPAGGRVVTNEEMNKIREELGF